MLSETWQLLQALQRSGFKLPRKHKRIQTPGHSSPCLRIRLDKKGKVSSVESVGDQDWPSWTVMEGNQNSFPVVRVQEPMINLERSDRIWEELGYDQEGGRRKKDLLSDQDRIKILEKAVKDRKICLYSEKTKKLWDRLRKQKAEELLLCTEQAGAQLEVVKDLAERFIKATENPDSLLKEVVSKTMTKLSRGQLTDITSVEQLLVGKGPTKENGGRANITIQLAFDVENKGSLPSLYSLKIRDHLIRMLPSEKSSKKSSKCGEKFKLKGPDAFTGETADLEEKNLPKIELPAVGTGRHSSRIGRKRFPLFSMFSAARCNRRYGLTDARVFPIAKERARNLKEALEFITSDERREKTWQHVASGRFERRQGRTIEKSDLLIAYVEDKPTLDAKTAGYFGAGQAVTEAKFEVDAKAICQAWKGIVRKKPHSRLYLFLIREVSKGQIQVALAESPTVQEAIDAAKRWQRAVRSNLPSITLPLPPKRKGQSAIRQRPSPPYPDQVVRLLSFQWVRDGSSPLLHGKRQKPNHEVSGPSLGEVLFLMLQIEGKWCPAAKRMLSLLLQRLTPLLIGVFGAKHVFAQRLQEPLNNYTTESRLTALRATAVLGILLNAVGFKKEDYMNNAAYQIGQVLALADTLHKDYCAVVRNGQLPSCLIGTALMRRALDNPAGAIADLSGRIIEYVRWAKTAKESSDWAADDRKRISIREARKKLRQFEPLAAQLGISLLPKESDDIMKAQLLLGFLASPPEEE